MARQAVFLWLIAVLAHGCSKSESSSGSGGDPTQSPAPSPAELERARAACVDYKAVVCERADTDEEYRDACRLADSRIESAALHERTLLGAGKMSPVDRAVVYRELRRTSTACIDDAGKLRAGIPDRVGPRE
jgi:hypothetical protein